MSNIRPIRDQIKTKKRNTALRSDVVKGELYCAFDYTLL